MDECWTEKRRKDAADKVRELLLHALPQVLFGIDVPDILCAIESVWNNYEPGSPPPSFRESVTNPESPAFVELVESLQEICAAWCKGREFFLFGLFHDTADGDIVFSSDLVLPTTGAVYAFEMRSVGTTAASGDRI